MFVDLLILLVTLYQCVVPWQMIYIKGGLII